MAEIQLKTEISKSNRLSILLPDDKHIMLTSGITENVNEPFTRMMISGYEKMTFNERIIRDDIRETSYLSKLQFRTKSKNAVGKEIFTHVVKILKKYIVDGKIEKSKIEILCSELEIPFDITKKKEKKIRELKVKKKKK